MATGHETLLIGLCDGAIDKKTNSSYFTNKIGDFPDQFPVISLQYPSCALCGTVLNHVVQVYCPLEASPYHRTINVFACTSPPCSGKSERYVSLHHVSSWKVLRSQCLDSEIGSSPGVTSMPVKEAPRCSTDWCDDADDWGMDNEEGEAECTGRIQTAENMTAVSTGGLDVSSRLKGLSIKAVEEPQPSAPAFQPFYISVVEETDLVGHNDMTHAHRLLREYEKREGVTVGELGSCDGDVGEKYEKSKARHGDAVFSSFMKKISVCPEQVLRYNWNGSPLFIADPPSNMRQMVPPCSHCGNPRMFEFQLMPALVSFLHSVDSSSDLALEFGTVLVYTCGNSCWTSGSISPVEEFLFVQADPDQQFFK